MVAVDIVLTLAVVLLAGFIAVGVANKYRLPHALFLIAAGMLLQKITFNGEPFIVLPSIMVYGFSVIALCMITFDAASRMKVHNLTTTDRQGTVMTLLNCGMNILLLTPLIQLLFFSDSQYNVGLWITSLLVAILMSESSLDTVSVTYQKVKHRAIKLLEAESVTNTPIFLFLVFVILSGTHAFVRGGEIVVQSNSWRIFFSTLVLALCSALLVGVVLFRYMRKSFSKIYSPIFLLAGILATYSLAMMVNANGFMAVLIVGLVFGKFTLHSKHKLEEFSSTFSVLIEIAVYLFLGLYAAQNLTLNFVFQSAVVYCALLFIRFIAVQFSVSPSYSFEEKLFFTVNTPKGISVAIVVLFLFLGSGYPGMAVLLDLCVMLLFYSHVGHAFTMGNKLHIKDDL